MKNIMKKVNISKVAPALFLLVLVIFYAIFAKNFTTTNNILNIFRQSSITGVMAIGVTMVILLGEIDLSIGTVLAFIGMLAGGFATGKYFGLPELPVWLSVVMVLVIGAIIGTIAGLAVAYLHIPGFMSTLAMEYVCHGIMLMVTGGKPIGMVPKDLLFFGSGYVGFMPMIIIIFIIIFIVGLVMLKYTVFGRNLYAIGGSYEAARMSGINVEFNKVMAFMFSSLMCALAGVMMVGRIGSSQVTAGDGLQMQPIAAAVLGGVSLAGGKGDMLGTLLGVLVMGVLVNGLNLMGVSSDAQKLVTGIVLYAAVAFNVWTARRDRR